MIKATNAFQTAFHQKVGIQTSRMPVGNARSVVSMAGHGRFFVGGNWKSNGTVESISQLCKDLNAGTIPADVDVVVAPPFVYLDQVKRELKGPYQISAQNCREAGPGAFTGEIAADQLVDIQVPWVILGHSERRSLYGETNEVVGTKTKYALSKGLKVIACVGETLQERESGQMFNILDGQLKAIAENVDDWTRVVVAYEPVWAIGTGVVATPQQAEDAHAYIREWISKNVADKIAAKLRLLYGGSVNDKNCSELAEQTDVDGFLVGGASLQGPAFVKICNALKATARA